MVFTKTTLCTIIHVSTDISKRVEVRYLSRLMYICRKNITQSYFQTFEFNVVVRWLGDIKTFLKNCEEILLV